MFGSFDVLQTDHKWCCEMLKGVELKTISQTSTFLLEFHECFYSVVPWQKHDNYETLRIKIDVGCYL